MTVELDGVTKRFGAAVAVDRVSVTFASGGLTAILGPSGCGKTTLLRLIGGYDTPDHGRVLIDGRDATTLPLRARGAAFVFQHGALFPHMSVADNVGFGLATRDAAARRRRVSELLATMQLDDCATRRPHELSGGEQQRVALARALATDAKLLLLDEPFAALDVPVRRELRARLRELHERTGITTLLVTHDADEAMEIADAAVVMRDGRVEQTGAPGEIYDAPVNAFVLGFLGPANAIARDAATAFVRPHEFRIAAHPFEGGYRATIERVIPLGARTRYACVLDGGLAVDIEIAVTPGPAAARVPGDVVYVAPSRERSFRSGGVA